MPDTVVYQSTTTVPVVVLGTDAQGRMLVTCPGCQEATGVVDPDGLIRCAWCEAMRERFRQLLADALERTIDG